jgi:Diacylglycerol acyltransferase
MVDQENQQQVTKESKAKSSSIILATAEPRFCKSNIPAWVSYWITFLAFPLNMMAMSVGLFAYGIFFTHNSYLRSFCLIYLAYMVFDSRRCDGIGYPTHIFPFDILRRFVRNNWLYGVHCAYYPIRLHKLAHLPATTATGEKTKYLFTCHPHGVIGVGTMSVFATDEVGFSKLYPNVDTYMTGLRQIFYTPFFRDWCLLGGILSSDKTSFEHIFETKHASAVINLGGAAEAFVGLGQNPVTGNTVMKLLLKDRMGFCKLALQHGVSLVPVISLEEHLLFDLLQSLPIFYKLQLYLQKHVLGFAPLVVWGNKAPLMPKRHPLNVFVGKPIACPRVPNPTSEQVNAKHQEYCLALEKMFHECKKEVKGCEDWELQLIEHPFKNM